MLNLKNRRINILSTAILYVVLLLSPTISFAAAPTNFADFLGIFTRIFDIAIPILITAALAGFFWGIAKMVLKADDANAREEGRKAMVFGIFALFALIAVWGIAIAVRRTFFGF
ncbi:hypothetical protein ACFL0K_00965 [Patescibacteria group bacterium]